MDLISPRLRPARILAATVAALAVGISAQPAMAAKKSCTRGGAKLEAISGDTRVVRVKAKRQSRSETRREHLLACWAKTGKRVRIAAEVDNGLDNIARTRVEIVQGRYVGVREHNEGGVSESIRARIYDARAGKLLHDSAECDRVDQGDFSGVWDVAFLDDGGMAIACRRLLVYRNATAEVEVLEPAGTDVRQVGVSRYSHGYQQRLFWTVVSGDSETTKSIMVWRP